MPSEKWRIEVGGIKLLKTKFREKVQGGNCISYIIPFVIFAVDIIFDNYFRDAFGSSASMWKRLVVYPSTITYMLVRLFLSLKSHLILYEDSLLCKGVFKTERIPYCSIKSAELYELSESISGFCDHYSEDIGVFYAIIYTGIGKEGVLVQTDAEQIYGGKLFISPRNPEEFVERLKQKIWRASPV